MDKWLAILKMLAPVVALAVPGGEMIAPLLPLIVTSIGDIQKSILPGADKKARVLANTADAIALTNQIAGKVVLEPTATLLAADKTVDAIVDAVNAVHKNVADLPPALPATA